jgi:uncharacterized membrane protein HdeD (DUF308 family)
LFLGVPGLVLLYGGLPLLFHLPAAGFLSICLGLGLLASGTVLYVQAKGQHSAWALLLLLPILGILGLALLPDRLTANRSWLP